MADLLRQALNAGIIPKKSLGQHFLINRGVIDKIIEAAGDISDQVVLEVGPGIGNLTGELAVRASKVIAVEKDAKLAEFLRRQLSDRNNVVVIEADALAVDISRLTPAPGAVVANLPYNIASTLIVHYLSSYAFINRYIVMVQREAARRMAARPGSTVYSGLSVKVQTVAEVDYLFEVSPGSFYPPPEVYSAVIGIVRKDIDMDLQGFFRFVDACFAHRRKKMVNNLVAAGLFDNRTQAEEFIGAFGINLNARPQEIPAEKYVRLYHAINK